MKLVAKVICTKCRLRFYAEFEPEPDKVEEVGEDEGLRLTFKGFTVEGIKCPDCESVRVTTDDGE